MWHIKLLIRFLLLKQIFSHGPRGHPGVIVRPRAEEELKRGLATALVQSISLCVEGRVSKFENAIRTNFVLVRGIQTNLLCDRIIKK